jgi:hypothetical protein
LNPTNNEEENQNLLPAQNDYLGKDLVEKHEEVITFRQKPESEDDDKIMELPNKNDPTGKMILP